MMPFFPLRKIKRNGIYLLFGAVLVVVGISAYLEYVATNTWDNVDDSQQKDQASHVKSGNGDQISNEDIVWSSRYVPQLWRSEYKGQANLHVFEDWCGSSIASLRKNPHYPLYPHSRITVKKLAVSPNWKNYGLRIFGYIHPQTNGEFVFAVACNNNCEFWMSRDENPENLRLHAHVGKTGEEWSAPGEYSKYTSQTSKPLLLQRNKRFYFELIHKHNSHGTDHVEVAWRFNTAETQFELIDSNSLSLYTVESSLKMSDVSHIPQTAASHEVLPLKKAQAPEHGAEMLREDLRDTFLKVRMPLLDRARLRGVLPECSYRPSYTLKGRQVGRYQGLQFVRMTYVYPNDCTRLTHMESENTCFYQMKPYYLEMYGLSQYMRLDQPQEKEAAFRNNGDYGEGWKDFRVMGRAGQDKETPYEEDFDYRDDSIQHQGRKLFANSLSRKRSSRRRRTNRQYVKGIETVQQEIQAADNVSVSERENQYKLQNQNKMADENQYNQGRPNKMAAGNYDDNHQRRNKTTDKNQYNQQKQNKTVENNQFKLHNQNKLVNENQNKQNKNKMRENNQYNQKQNKMADRNQYKQQRQNKIGDEKHVGWMDVIINQKGINKRVVQVNHVMVEDKAPLQDQRSGEKTDIINKMKNNTRKISASRFENHQPGDLINQKRSQGIIEHNIHQNTKYNNTSTLQRGGALGNEGVAKTREELIKDEAEVWMVYGDSDMEGGDFRDTYDPEIRWDQTFQVSQTDFQTMRTDWIDLNCNVSGNLLISQSEVTALVQAFMEKLQLKYPRKFSLQRVVNVEKREDERRGSRYLLELELMEESGARVRLVHYVYVLQFKSIQRPSVNFDVLLCNPHNFLWNPDATIHIIVPVKNQARWVQKFIVDMEELYRGTGDENINIIIVDFSSTDMDVEQVLKNSRLPKSQYLRLTGNFERSAGLQAGIDLIANNHSIVFLCDLHLHFPLGFFDSVRKHCVEGHMAFAPLVMRLNCGATPQEPDGYWEVNGFGLLGIYKSDLNAVGGMNTKEFKNRWGGEDWELLDRIIEAGLEVERLHLRNFFHYHHSRRGMWNRKTLRRT
ncbi:beta-1,4-N-acetylgalactosaminyltransferase 3 [Silurus meridionalis]|uniref:beta-1,4-N-acetylgalactosaminyltransferase 3 n=1 Tax=Silurus meridionalis TaxID=175797 RepID=UPI001EEBAD2E|nr:beta-1,4-N-acetylgalactosaminyltransferase 3 [Silurus meridionalis]